MTCPALMLLALTLSVAAPQTIGGTVRDGAGAAIPGASIVATPSSGRGATTTSDANGAFTIARPAGEVVVLVSAPGFRAVRRIVAAGDPPDLAVTLVPALDAEVTVTAGRFEQRLADVAATVSIVDRIELDRSPAMTTDDVLRQVPAFSLFRRSSSLAAHPTAQGVSLRGLGPSGVSRTLVLLDGVPFNDPFGGWISWARVPQGAVDRIEIAEGSSASLFGNYSIGGAINILTRRPDDPWIAATLQYGERATPRVDVSAALRRNRWTLIADTGAFHTDGYEVVAADERGAVDEKVSADSRRVYASVGYAPAGRTTLHGRADLFDESRQNGKRSTIDGTPEQNDTGWSSFGVGVRTVFAGGSELRTDVFVDHVRFRSNFLAVPAATPARSVGRMTLEQFVPSSSLGAASQWTLAATGRSVLTAGLDWRRVDGESREDVLDGLTGSRTVLLRRSGGTQDNVGLFVQNVITPMSPLVLTLALRHDRWTNHDGHNLETDTLGVPTANHRPSLPDRGDHVTTPRVAALLRAASGVSLWTSAGWGFRAPTLNELYRQFRVGLVTTLANEALGAERLRSVEAGIRVAPHPSILVRSAWFDSALRDAISNVTLPASPSGTIQQRMNLGLTRVRGAQADLDWRPSSRARVSAAYIYNNAVVREFAANPALAGNQLPQVPRHRGSVQVVAAEPRIADVTLGLNVTGRQFDDDLNTRAVPGRREPGLPGFTSVDLLVSRTIGRSVSLFVGAQNLFNERSYAGTLPTTLGAPRVTSVGIRWQPSVRR